MSEEIENLLNQAIEFLNKDLETSQALSNMLVTFILQLLATLVLFLVIRFKFWNVITAMIEKRETKIWIYFGLFWSSWSSEFMSVSLLVTRYTRI